MAVGIAAELEGKAAVVTGARHASRVVVAAALIMFSVFASFVTIEDVIVKAIALGLAVGILVDAFVVRMTLVPAVLALLGRSTRFRRTDRTPNAPASTASMDSVWRSSSPFPTNSVVEP